MGPDLSSRTCPHFSLQVRSVQSAYIRAAGSEFARKPTSNGAFESFERPSATSVRRFFATIPAKTTLQEAGPRSDVPILIEKQLPQSISSAQYINSRQIFQTTAIVSRIMIFERFIE